MENFLVILQISLTKSFLVQKMLYLFRILAPLHRNQRKIVPRWRQRELKNFLEFGVIKNSVNFPDCDVPYSGKGRIAIAHKNIPNMLSSITSALARADVNIDNLINKSKGQWAYTIADVDEIDVDKVDEIIAEIKKVNGVVRARVVRLS